MFKTRILTALVMLVVFLATLLFANQLFFTLLMLVVVAMAAYEWACLCLSNPALRWLYTVVVASLCLLFWYSAWASHLVILSSIIWLISPLLLTVLVRNDTRPGLLILPGVLFLTAAYVAILSLRWSVFPELDWHLILSCLMIVWCADSFAYITGKRFGQRKLAPNISPGKTWEGVLGGLLSVVLVATTYWWLMSGHFPELNWWLAICLITGVFSVLGDLMESCAKRIAGVKDSGNILPGHGGVLDRIDGVLAAAPIFMTLLLGYQWLQS
ncbi:MAG: phosphatidate cytidylyltransferase [Parasphingorhabdus sp.]|jgi:phosphatidate cytidylyltransferase